MGIPEIAKTYLYPLATMCNTIIGIGIFTLPYIAVKVGLPIMFLYFVVLGVLVTITHLMFGELALKTADYKRMPGFVKVYLGEKWAMVERVTALIGFIGSMVAFMVIGGQFLFHLASPVLGGSESLYGLLYLLAGSVLIYFGISIVSRIGAYGLLLFFVILVVLIAKGSHLIGAHNLMVHTGTAGDIFFPYGPILFSLWASSSIPEVEEMLGRSNRKDLLKPTIIIAEVIALVTYLVFVILIVGTMGAATTKSALVGLGAIFGSGTANLLFLFGFVISFCSFTIMGLTLKKILSYDLKVEKHLAWAFVTFVPAGLFCMGFKNFISIFSLVGGVFLGLDGMLIVIMYQKIHPAKKILTYPLLAVFVAGMVYEIAYYLIRNG